MNSAAVNLGVHVSFQIMVFSSICPGLGLLGHMVVLFLVFCLFVCFYFFGCVRSSLLHMGFLYLWRAGVTLRCGAWASHCGSFSCCGAQALGTWASVVAACGLSSCGTQAQ